MKRFLSAVIAFSCINIVPAFRLRDGPQTSFIYDNPLNYTDSIELINFIEIATSDITVTEGYGKAPRLPETGISSAPYDVKFYLYTNPMNPDEFTEIIYGSKSQAREAIQRRYYPSGQWKFLIHGFTQNKNSPFPQLLVKEYMKRMSRTGEKYNVVVVDWGKLAGSMEDTYSIPYYYKAVQNVDVAGKRVGEMISWLKRLLLEGSDPANMKFVTPITDLSKVHIIGFSLGAHVAGVAGNQVNVDLSRCVGRMTGLDPAGPYFYNKIKKIGRRLRSEDADAMDVIHTNWNGYGIAEELGDANFYPNPSLRVMLPHVQPYCRQHWFIFGLSVCSHNLAPVFYAFSINHPDRLISYQCGGALSFLSNICPELNKSFMGEDWNTSDVGSYYLSLTSGPV